MKTSTGVTIGVVIIVVIIILAVFVKKAESRPGEYDTFAQCIEESGTTFYGAFWCPHCEDQRNNFGRSKQYLPYIECSNPDRTMTQECVNEGVESYPTWDFPDGTRVSGTQSMEFLAEKTNCELPE